MFTDNSSLVKKKKISDNETIIYSTNGIMFKVTAEIVVLIIHEISLYARVI